MATVASGGDTLEQEIGASGASGQRTGSTRNRRGPSRLVKSLERLHATRHVPRDAPRRTAAPCDDRQCAATRFNLRDAPSDSIRAPTRGDDRSAVRSTHECECRGPAAAPLCACQRFGFRFKFRFSSTSSRSVSSFRARNSTRAERPHALSTTRACVCASCNARKAATRSSPRGSAWVRATDQLEGPRGRAQSRRITRCGSRCGAASKRQPKRDAESRRHSWSGGEQHRGLKANKRQRKAKDAARCSLHPLGDQRRGETREAERHATREAMRGDRTYYTYCKFIRRRRLIGAHYSSSCSQQLRPDSTLH